MNKLVAVYGTLRQGEGNHQVLGDSKYMATTRLSGFKMYGKINFPAIVKGEKEDTIVVEIYRITNPNIANQLDILEGFDRSIPNSLDNLYTVRMIKVPSIEEPIEIYTFDHNPNQVIQRGPHLEHGDWKKRSDILDQFNSWNLYLEKQKKICQKFNSIWNPIDKELMVGCAENLNEDPIHGLRHIDTGVTTTGWYIWTGDFSEDPNFFKPICAEHLLQIRPEIIKYFGLDFGFRFLIDKNGYEDVWFDKKLTIN